MRLLSPHAVVYETDDDWIACICEYGLPNLIAWLRDGFSTSTEAEIAIRKQPGVRGVKIVYLWGSDNPIWQQAGHQFASRQLASGDDVFSWD